MLNDLNLEGLKGKKITFIPRNKILKIDYKKIASEFRNALKESFKAVWWIKAIFSRLWI